MNFVVGNGESNNGLDTGKSVKDFADLIGKM